MTARPAIFRTSLIVALSIAALFLLDEFLAKTETREMQSAAAAAYSLGTRLLAQGKAADAVEPLRKAWVLVRENPGYELQLGNALAATGKIGEADSLIMEALNREPNDGEANLAAARLRIRQNRAVDADSFYHRAIYGQWRNDADAHRIPVRLELIEILAKQKRRDELLAESIALEGEAGNDVAVQKKLARFFLLAGAPARSADVYRALVEKDRLDGESYLGLGEAELQSGRYSQARSAFVRAALHNPGAPIQSRLQLVDTLTALDPTPRQLTSLEKYRRSRRILDWIRTDIAQQLQAKPEKSSGELAGLLRQATEALERREPAHVSNEAAEDLLSLAEHLWRVRVQAFGDVVPPAEEPLRLILEKLAA
ncbi:MAG: hypothetical protein ABUS51_01185 [Acidobacteriota bacterium]